MDLYGKTFLVKVAHIFIVYHPLKERKSVSVTKHKIWAIEICPKMSLSTPDFTFWAISQDRDAPGQFYLTTRDHHGCRNLGQHQSQIFWIFPRNELLKDLSTMVLMHFLILKRIDKKLYQLINAPFWNTSAKSAIESFKMPSFFYFFSPSWLDW